MFFMARVGWGQEKTVTGTVRSFSDNESLPGVNVTIKGTTMGTTTASDGTYTVKFTQENAVLIFSFIGFGTKEVEVGNQTVIDVSLEDDIQQLGEVIVVGYGEQDRRTLTSAISKVSAAEIRNVPTPNASQLIQGRAAGVLVSANSGEPGTGALVRVRGSTSINASSDPLYVIDGIPIVSANLARTTFGQATSPIADLNPADIESIEILKDASATAIYGARAANGVILITTKRGATSRPKISINTYAGTSTAWRDPNDLRVDGPTFEKLQNEAAANNWMDTHGGSLTGFTPTYANPDDAINTNWMDQIFQDGALFNLDANVSGGTEKVKYLVSGNRYKQEGLIKPTNFERTSGRANLDFMVSDKIKLGTSIFYSTTVRNRVQNGNNINGALTNAFFYPSNIPIYEADGITYKRPVFENPVAVVKETQYKMVTDRLIGNIFADWEITPGLIFKTSWSLDNNYVTEDQYSNSKTTTGGGVNGSGSSSVTQDLNWINENILSYQFERSDKHKFNFLLGNTLQKNTNTQVVATGQQYPGDNFTKISSAAITTSRADMTQWGIASLFGRINYNYADKYLFTTNMRYDGSSRFGANNRWGFFPSASAGWVMSNEQFMDDVTAVSELKLRVSYGVTGNQSGIPNFASRGLWGGQRGGLVGGGGTVPINTTTQAAAYGDFPGFNPIQLANPDLKWETTSQFDIGFDLGLFEDKVRVTFDYYNKQTKDLLLNVPVPRSTGYNVLVQNYGEMENKGVELAVKASAIAKESLTWDIGFNISQNKNLVKKIAAPFPQFTRDYIRVQEGFPLYSFWAHEQIGVDPQTGNAIWNTGTDDVFDPNVDRFIVGNAWPDFIGGLTNDLRYKNFDLTAFFQFSVGNEIFNYNRFFYEHGGERTTGYSSQQLDRWQKPGDVTDVPRMARVNYNSNLRPSRHIEDGSYLRLKNLNIGYTLPKTISNKLGMSNLRLYVAGQNLLTFTKYSGLDPEVSADAAELIQGVDYAVMPQPRIWMGGVNITF